MSIPAQALFVTAETEDRRARKADEEQGRRLAALAAVDLFTPLGADERATLAAALRPEPFAAGETVTHEGEPGLGLYLITRGRAVVQLGTGERARQVAELGAGQFFGEMSLMTGAARSATVVAATDLECYRIDKDVFQTLITRAARDRRSDRRGPRRPSRGPRVGPRPARRDQPRRRQGRPGRSHPRLLRPARVGRRRPGDRCGRPGAPGGRRLR
jgi:hypothetical protein